MGLRMLQRMLYRRFVGYITNFIHNRKDPDINMLRGYLTSTVGRSVAPDRMEAIRQRARANAGPAETRGFLSTSSDVLDQEGKSVAGSGEIRYKLPSRSHTKPKYKQRKLRRLRQKVEAFVAQTGVQDFVPPRRVLCLKSAVSFNGKPWKREQDACFI